MQWERGGGLAAGCVCACVRGGARMQPGKRVMYQEGRIVRPYPREEMQGVAEAALLPPSVGQMDLGSDEALTPLMIMSDDEVRDDRPSASCIAIIKVAALLPLAAHWSCKRCALLRRPASSNLVQQPCY